MAHHAQRGLAGPPGVVGVLATLAPDGQPRQSLVYYARDGERLLISTLAQLLAYLNHATCASVSGAR